MAFTSHTEIKFTSNLTVICLMAVRRRAQKQQLPSKMGLNTMLSNAAFVIEFNFNRKGYIEHEKLALLVTEFL